MTWVQHLETKHAKQVEKNKLIFVCILSTIPQLHHILPSYKGEQLKCSHAAPPCFVFLVIDAVQQPFNERLLTQLSIKSMPEFCWGKNNHYTQWPWKCSVVCMNLYQQQSNIYGHMKTYFSLARTSGSAEALVLSTSGRPQCAGSDSPSRVSPCRMIPVHKATGVNIWIADPNRSTDR